MHSLLRIRVVLISLWYCVGVAEAEIAGISGSVADGERIVISGSGFGSKPRGAAPYAVFDFGKGEGAGSSFSRSAWPAPNMGILDAGTKSQNSRASWKYRIGLDKYDLYNNNILKPPPPYLYIYYKMLVNWDGVEASAARPDWNMKGFRFWSEGYKSSVYMPGYADNVANGNPRTYFEGTNGGIGYYDKPFGLAKDRWKTEELFLRQSSAPGITDGVWWMTSGGQRNKPIENVLTSNAAYPGPYSFLAWYQLERAPFLAADGKFLAFDIIYIDDSWARVLVTDRATWSDAAQQRLEIQIPVTWEDARIEFVARQGEFDTLFGKFLYVVDSSGKPVSSTGFPLGNIVKPAPPSAVTAN